MAPAELHNHTAYQVALRAAPPSAAVAAAAAAPLSAVAVASADAAAVFDWRRAPGGAPPRIGRWTVPPSWATAYGARPMNRAIFV